MKGFTKYLLLGALTALPTIGFTEMAMAQTRTGGPPVCGQPCKDTQKNAGCRFCCDVKCSDEAGAVVDKCYEYCDNEKPLAAEEAVAVSDPA